MTPLGLLLTPPVSDLPLSNGAAVGFSVGKTPQEIFDDDDGLDGNLGVGIVGFDGDDL